MDKALCQRSWEWTATKPVFTPNELANDMDVTLETAKEVVRYLRMKGVIKTVDNKIRPCLYAAVQGSKLDFNRKVKERGDSNSYKQRMWQAMRFLNRFTMDDVQATAEAPRASVKKFITHLVKAGYVRILTPYRRNLSQDERLKQNVQYLLIRNSGRRYPVINCEKGEVYDQNEDATYKMPRGSGVRNAAVA